MSKTIDERVVQMRFDNTGFEENVQSSMTILEKLKTSISGLSDSSKAIGKIDTSGVDFNPLTKGIDTAKEGFSGLQIMAMRTFSNIADDVYGLGKKIANELFAAPKDGFKEYETQINAVQTIMANTGLDVDTVNAGLDELNVYADKTIYNFAQMTDNISKFVAAGIDYDTARTNLMGIGNWAAATGTDAQSMARVTYQISQALSSGVFQLMDWRSIENTPMSGKKYREAIVENAKAYYEGVTSFKGSAEELKKVYGSTTKEKAEAYLKTIKGIQDGTVNFRDSLKEKWLTSDIFSKTMSQFAKDQTMLDAATKVKTFTQLIDTLKEAMGSGWTQTWRILIGDFVEAKDMFTNIFTVIGGLIDNVSDKRNKLLQGWADLGGRQDLIDIGAEVWADFEGIINAISTGMGNLFDSIEPEDLKAFTSQLLNFVKEWGPNDNTFEGITKGIETVGGAAVSAVDYVGSFLAPLKNLIVSDIPKLGSTAGKLIDNVFNMFDKIDKWIQGLGNAGEATQKLVDKINEIKKSIANFVMPEGFLTFFKTVIDLGKSLGKDTFKVVSDGVVGLFDGIAKSMDNGSVDKIIKLGTTGSLGLLFANLAGIAKENKGLSIKSIIETILNPGKDTANGAKETLDKTKDTLGSLKGTLEEYQKDLDANIMLKIGGAIFLLASACSQLGNIDADRVNQSIGAMTILIGELVGASWMIKGLDLGLGLGQSTGVLILAKAMEEMVEAFVPLANSVKGNGDNMITAINTMGLLIGELVGFYAIMGGLNNVGLGSGAKGFLSGVTLIILAKGLQGMVDAIIPLTNIKSSANLGTAVGAMTVILAELAAFSAAMSSNAGGLNALLQTMVLPRISEAMEQMADVIITIASVPDPSKIGTALGAITILLTELAAFEASLSSQGGASIISGFGMILVGAALEIVADVMQKLADLPRTETGKALGVLTAALVEIGIAIAALSNPKNLLGGAAITVMAIALKILVPVLAQLGKLNFEETITGLVETLVELGIAAFTLSALSTFAGGILTFSAALAGLGAALFVLSAGLAALTAGKGLASLEAQVSGIATGVGTSIKKAFDFSAFREIIRQLGSDIIHFLPDFIGEFVDSVVKFFKNTLTGGNGKDGLSTLVDIIVQTIYNLTTTLKDYIGPIANNIIDMLISIIDVVITRVPELVAKGKELINVLFSELFDSFGDVDAGNLLSAVEVFGVMAVIVRLMNGIAVLIPEAIIGIGGCGVLIAEIALCLTALGALYRIPGLSDLLNDGGKLISDVFAIVGNVVGSLIGGFIDGAVSQSVKALPDLGMALSLFATSALPFFTMVKSVGQEGFDAVTNLSKSILMLTSAELIEHLTTLLGGHLDFKSFGMMLVDFGDALVQFSDKVKGKIDSASVEAAAAAGQMIADLSKSLPNSGGLIGMIVGNNDLGDFATGLGHFGWAIASFMQAIGSANFDTEKSKSAIQIANDIVAMSASIENSGGIAGLIFGDNDISTFGDGLQYFGKCVAGFAGIVSDINFEGVNAAIASMKKIASLGSMNGISKIKDVGYDLVQFSNSYKEFASNMNKTDGINSDKILGSAKDLGKDIGNSVKIDTTTLNKNMTSAGAGAVTAIASGANKSKDTITTTFGNAMKNALAKVRGYRDDFNKAGSYVVSGFANGISDHTFAAEAKAAAMASAALRKAKNVLDEHSPSRATYEMGDFFVQGFANGISENVAKATRASEKVANSTLLAFKDVTNGVKAIIEDDGGLNPVITPVLDLSDVEQNAGRLTNMLNAATVKPSLQLGAISADATNTTIQNSLLTDAVNKLGDKLDRNTRNNKPGDTYNVNGVTYDDGTNVSNAVNDLITAIKIGRRN